MEEVIEKSGKSMCCPWKFRLEISYGGFISHSRHFSVIHPAKSDIHKILKL